MLIGTTEAEFDRFMRHYSVDDPRHHAVAIAWVFDTAQRRLLLLRHRTHGWSCPGGHIEPGETPAAAAARELGEETGVTTTPLSTKPFVIARSNGCPRSADPDVVHWALGFRFEVPSSTAIVAEAGQRGRWYPMEALPRHRPDDVDAVIAQLGQDG